MFRAESTIEICSHHLHTTPTPMSVRASRAVPQPLEELVLACLAKKPEERPTTDALVARLRGFLAETWGRWEESDATAWWRANGAAVAEHRARSVESVDQTVIARKAPSTSSSVATDATEVGKHPPPARSSAA